MTVGGSDTQVVAFQRVSIDSTGQLQTIALAGYSQGVLFFGSALAAPGVLRAALIANDLPPPPPFRGLRSRRCPQPRLARLRGKRHERRAVSERLQPIDDQSEEHRPDRVHAGPAVLWIRTGDDPSDEFLLHAVSRVRYFDCLLPALLAASGCIGCRGQEAGADAGSDAGMDAAPDAVIICNFVCGPTDASIDGGQQNLCTQPGQICGLNGSAGAYDCCYPDVGTFCLPVRCPGPCATCPSVCPACQ